VQNLSFFLLVAQRFGTLSFSRLGCSLPPDEGAQGVAVHRSSFVSLLNCLVIKSCRLLKKCFSFLGRPGSGSLFFFFFCFFFFAGERLGVVPLLGFFPCYVRSLSGGVRLSSLSQGPPFYGTAESLVINSLAYGLPDSSLPDSLLRLRSRHPYRAHFVSRGGASPRCRAAPVSLRAVGFGCIIFVD